MGQTKESHPRAEARRPVWKHPSVSVFVRMRAGVLLPVAPGTFSPCGKESYLLTRRGEQGESGLGPHSHACDEGCMKF